MQEVNNFKIDTFNSLYISKSPLPIDVFSYSIQHRTPAVFPDVKESVLHSECATAQAV